MASLPEVEAAFLKADAAGDTAAAKALAAEVRRLRAEKPAVSQDAPDPLQAVRESGPMRFIQGMRDSIDAGAQGLARLVPESVTAAIDKPFAAMRNSDSPLISTIGQHFFADPRAAAVGRSIATNEQQYQSARNARAQGQDPGFDAFRFAGNVASPTNAVLAAATPVKAMTTVPRMAAAGAALGAAGGALTPVTSERDQENFGASKAIQMLEGAGTGAVLTPVIGKVLQAAAPYVARVWDNLPGASTIARARASMETDNVISMALKDLGQTIDDIPKAQYDALRQQVNTALQGGRKLDAAALLRKGDFDAMGMPSLQGQITRDPTQFARERNLRGVSGVGEPIQQRLDVQNQLLQRLYGGAADGASEAQTAGAKLVAALQGKDQELQSGVSTAYKAARASAGKDMNVPLQGLAQDAASVLEDFADKVPTAVRNKLNSYGILSGGNQTKVFTFDEANKLLQTINDHVGADKATNTALGRLRNAVKDAMLQSGENDVFSGARAAAAERFKLHDAVPALKAAAEGTASPDRFVQQYIIAADTPTVKKLAQALTPEAFKEARAQVGSVIQRAAFGENLAGDKLLAPERLSKALRQIGTEKLQAFFSPAEVEQMYRGARVGSYINSTPTSAAVNTSNTAATALNLAGQIPGIPAKVNMLRAPIQSIIDQRAVAAAVNPKVPSTATQPSPEVLRRLRLAAALGGLAGGEASAGR